MRKLLLLVVALVSAWSVPAVLADSPLKSPSYSVDESFIGGGGLVTENSTNYAANESIGDTGIGNSTSTSFQTNGGYTTTSDPALTFIVNTSNINFGALSSSTTATANATFSVIDYTSYGYNVIALGSPPTNGTHTLANMAATATSQIGVEQFGFNLRTNSSPIAFGSDPSGGFGTWGTGYGTVNQYKYNPGDIISTSAKSSGQTNFTVSYIVNASVTTGGGSYSGQQTLICVGTY